MSVEYVDSALTLGKGALVNFGGAVSRYALAFVFSFVVARLVGAEVYGVYTIAFGILAIARVIGTLGLKSGITRYTAIFRSEDRLDKVKGTLLGALRLNVAASVPLAAVLMVASTFIGERIYDAPAMASVLRLMLISLPLWTVTECLEGYVQGFKVMRYGIFAKNVLQPITELAAAIVVILVLGWGANGLAAGHTVSVLVALVFMYVLSRRFLASIKGAELTDTTGEIVRFSSPLLVLGLLQLVGAKANPLILGALSNSQDAGIYSVALQAASLGVIFRQAFGQILGPIASEVHHRRDLKQLGWLYSRATRWTITLSLPVFLILAVHSELVLGIFGKEFLSGSQALIVLAIAQTLNVATGSSGLILTMCGKPGMSMLNQLASLVLNLVLNFLLIPRYGLLGAAIANAAATILVNLARVLEVYWFLGVQPYRRELIKPLVAGAVSLLVLQIPRALVGDHTSAIGFVLDSLAFGVAYLASLYVMGLEEDDVHVVHTLVRRLGYTSSTSKP
jgi:O-antigen/teichoic acid export membrane protein